MHVLGPRLAVQVGPLLLGQRTLGLVARHVRQARHRLGQRARVHVVVAVVVDNRLPRPARPARRPRVTLVRRAALNVLHRRVHVHAAAAAAAAIACSGSGARREELLHLDGVRQDVERAVVAAEHHGVGGGAARHAVRRQRGPGHQLHAHHPQPGGGGARWGGVGGRRRGRVEARGRGGRRRGGGGLQRWVGGRGVQRDEEHLARRVAGVGVGRGGGAAAARLRGLGARAPQHAAQLACGDAVKDEYRCSASTCGASWGRALGRRAPGPASSPCGVQ